MIIIVGLVILIAAVVLAVAGVLTNAGSGHALPHDFAVFGYHVTGSTGTLFLYGVRIWDHHPNVSPAGLKRRPPAHRQMRGSK